MKKTIHHRRRTRLFAFLGLLLALIGASRADAQPPTVIYVNASAAAGGNGTSWATAYRDLQEALDESEALPIGLRNVEVWVANGIYRPSRRLVPADPLTAQFTIPRQTSVFGGFIGTETTRAAADPSTRATILTGDLLGNDGPSPTRTNFGDNANNVVEMFGDSVLDGFLVTSAQANGIQIFGPASSVVSRCVVTRCLRGISTRQGGEHHIKFCKLILNDAQGNLGGGAVNAEGALVTFYSCVFTQNTANGGAALASYRGGAWLYNCTVFANATTGLGGAVLVSSEAGAGTVTIVNSILEENAGAVVNALGTAGGVVQGIHTTFVGGGIAGGYNDLGGNSYASSPQIAPGASGADGVFGTPDDLPVLRSDASAIDTGTNTSFINFTTTDLLGNRRVHDGDANGVATVDRGAVEHLSPRYSPLLYVHAGLATGRNDGTDWNNAFRGSQGLQNALLFASVQNSLPRSPGESAVPYPSMWVARGTYTPAPPGGSRSASFSLQNNLAIYGGFQGNETSLNQRQSLPTTSTTALDPTRATILSGDLNGDDSGDINRNDNALHVTAGIGVASTAMLDGVTIYGGTANGSTPGNDQIAGGMINTNGGSPTVRNTIFLANHAVRGGAVQNSEFSTATFTDCRFLNNRVTTGGGGAVFNSQSSGARFVRCLFQENAAGTLNGGGAVNNLFSSPSFVDCDFIRNICDVGGGAVLNSQSSSPVFMASRFLGNRTGEAGGAVHSNASSSPSLIGCLLVNNVAVGGPCAAVWQQNGQLTIINSSIVRNVCLALPNGSVHLDQAASAIIRNSILWGNGPASPTTQGNQLVPAGGSLLIEHSIIEGWTGSFGGTASNGLNPLFLRMPSAGSDALWGTIDDDYGDLRLANGSPAIDSGDSLAVPADALDIDNDANTTEALPLDLAGNPRFYDDPSVGNTGNGSPPVDRGAYESNLATSRWIGASGASGNGSWGSAANWSGGLPNSTVRAVFDATVPPPLAYSVTISTSSNAYSLSHSANQLTLNLTGGNVALAGPALDATPPLTISGTPANDPRMTLRSSGISQRSLTAPALGVATSIGSVGRLTATGLRFTLNVTDTASVGSAGAGLLTVQQQSTVNTMSLLLGSAAGSNGTVSVTDSNSLLSFGGLGSQLIIGDQGTGSLAVSAGGLFGTSATADLVSIGKAAGSTGSMAITGQSSLAIIGSDTFVLGDFGSGTLTISNGGHLLTETLQGVILAREPGSSATVNIGAGSSWTETTSTIVVGGTTGSGTASVVIQPGGQLIAPVGTTIQTTGTISGSGTIASSVFNLGTIRPGQSPGTLTIDGSFRQLTPPAVGGAPLDSGKLELEVAGDAPGQADKLVVTGPAELGGGLFINFLDNYRPAPGSSLGLQLVSAGVLDPDARFDVAYLPPVLSPAGMPDGRFLKVEYPAAAPLGIRAAGDITLALGSLGSPITYLPPDGASVDGTPTGVAIGDLNGDGLDDLAISVPSSANPTGTGGSVVVLINRGGDWQGFPSAGGPGSIQLATANEPRGLVIADIDGDGRKDLAVANASSNTVSLFANTTPAPASATFAPAGSVSFPGRPVDLVADNFNGPDRRDLAVACEDADSVTVRRAVGAGFVFDSAAVSISMGSKPRSVAAFNPDQDKDVNRKKIVAAYFASNTVGVINTSAGSVGGSLTLSPLQTINVAPGPVKVVAQPLVRTAGVNRIAFTGGGAVGEGRTVLITVNQSAASNATASVIAPNPDPATQATVPFNPAVDIPAGIAPRGVIAADLDADLDDELVIVTNVGTTTTPDYKLRVLRNDLLTGTTANQQLAFVFDRDIDAGVNPLFVVQGRLVTDDPNAPRDLVTVNDPPAIASSPADAATLGQEPNIRPLRNRTTTTPLGCSPADIANTDGDPLPDNAIDNGDFTAFFNAFFLDSSDPARLIADIANTDGDTTLTGAGPDGTVDNGDFTAFFNFFFEGCGIM